MVDPEDLDEATRYLDGLPDEEIRRIDRGEIDPDEISFIESLKIEDKVAGGLCRTSRNSPDRSPNNSPPGLVRFFYLFVPPFSSLTPCPGRRLGR